VLLPTRDQDLPDPLLGPLGHVVDLGVPRQPGVDAKQVEAACVGIGEGLEDVRDQLPVLLRGDFDLLAINVESADRAAHRRGRQILDQGLEQPRGAEVLGRDAAGDREDLAVGDPPLQDGDDLIVVDLLTLEIALHELV
jgi:hypothetical protein